MNFICLQEENEGRKGKERMTEKKQKLELTWIGKEEQPRLEPRILLEDNLEFQKRMHGMRLTESGSSLSARLRGR